MIFKYLWHNWVTYNIIIIHVPGICGKIMLPVTQTLAAPLALAARTTDIPKGPVIIGQGKCY